jgi:hypothetical protein
MIETVEDRVAKALFRSRFSYLDEVGLKNRWYEDDGARHRAQADAKVALAEVEKALAVSRTGRPIEIEVANDAPLSSDLPSVTLMFDPSPTIHTSRPSPLHFPLSPPGFDEARVARGAVAGMPGWFWWEQVQPPSGIEIEYATHGSTVIHRAPSSQSPVSLHNKIWRAAP